MKQRLPPGVMPKYQCEALRREKAAARQARRQAQSKLRKLIRPEPKETV
jgi:hypothetical protein